MDRLKDLLGFGSEDPDSVPAYDPASRSVDELIEDRDAVREALANKDSLSVADLRAVVELGKAANAELASRAELDTDIATLTAPDPEPEPEVVPDATVAEVVRPDAATPADEETPAEVEESNVVVMAAAGGPGSAVLPGSPLIETADDLGRAMQSAWDATSAPSSGSVRHRAVHKQWDMPHVVDDGASAEDNYRTIQASFEDAQREARDQLYNGAVIQAASGICGPLEPRYSFLQLASATAGIINLPGDQVTRGGLRMPQAITAYALRSQTGIAFPYTSANGAAGVTKATYTVACPGISDFQVTAHQTNLRFSNFQGQFFPEYVSHVTDVAMAKHAHNVNEFLIDAIIASADTVTYDSNGGSKLGDAWAQFVRQMSFHVFLYRDKYLASQDLIVDVVLPWRALGALTADITARTSTIPTEGFTFQVQRAIADFGRELGVRFQFVYDYMPMTEIPNDFGSEPYEALIFPTGEVQNMSGGTLDLGVVRDSTRNSLNEFDVWTETFDGIATAGYEIMRVTDLQFCPNGSTGATVTIECDVSGS